MVQHIKLAVRIVLPALVLAIGQIARGQGSGYTIPAFAGEFRGEAPAPTEPLSVWFRKPAQQWVQAFPIGNGRLGAMVFGGIVEEHLQLNEDTLWAGGPYDPANPDALGALPQIRQLIFDGQYQAAHQLIADKFLARPL